jgi:hypothetical protein
MAAGGKTIDGYIHLHPPFISDRYPITGPHTPSLVLISSTQQDSNPPPLSSLPCTPLPGGEPLQIPAKSLRNALPPTGSAAWPPSPSSPRDGSDTGCPRSRGSREAALRWPRRGGSQRGPGQRLLPGPDGGHAGSSSEQRTCTLGRATTSRSLLSVCARTALVWISWNIPECWTVFVGSQWIE